MADGDAKEDAVFLDAGMSIQPRPPRPLFHSPADFGDSELALAQDLEFVGALLDAYAADDCRMGVASSDPEDAGIPPEMQVGEVNAKGWVEWRILPSTLCDADVAAVESEYGVQFPPLFRAYLLARFQRFSQVHSRRHDQLIFMTDTPSRDTLEKLINLLSGWRPLIDAGFVPFAEWGDGWGPMCFDAACRKGDGDCPVVWMDHEMLIPLGPENCRKRDSVLPLVQPLYASCREFLLDVFGRD